MGEAQINLGNGWNRTDYRNTNKLECQTTDPDYVGLTMQVVAQM
jgi:hypothetical protein